MQVGEAAVDERADEVERQRGALVAAQDQVRVRHAILGREPLRLTRSPRKLGSVLTVAGLRIRRARLCVLPGHAADADDGFLQCRTA